MQKKPHYDKPIYQLRRLGIRPCNSDCPHYQGCPVKVGWGLPCPVEVKDIAEFIERMVKALGLEHDPVGIALVELAAAQRIRVKRISAYLAAQGDSRWGAGLHRLLELQNKFEKEYRDTLLKIRQMGSKTVEVNWDELMELDGPEPEGKDQEVA